MVEVRKVICGGKSALREVGVVMEVVVHECPVRSTVYLRSNHLFGFSNVGSTDDSFKSCRSLRIV